jgi:hypothetical protein
MHEPPEDEWVLHVSEVQKKFYRRVIGLAEKVDGALAQLGCELSATCAASFINAKMIASRPWA